LEITEDVVRRVAEAANIPKEEWQRLERYLLLAHRHCVQSKSIYGGLRTKRDKLVIANKAKYLARALHKLCKDHPWLRGYIVSQEEGAAASERRDLDAGLVDADPFPKKLVERFDAIISHIEKRPSNTDERIAKAGATKQHLSVFDSYIVEFWQQTMGRVSYHERSGFVEFFSAFDRAANPFAKSKDEPLSATTIKSRVKRMMKWKSKSNWLP